ncbi:granulocyte-macrophage colony-stimulating factor receptor subunit alpha-like isoform X2 [Perca flavescens]|uniref:granulocyte-macrophage colony-stimulating factor receptor subunit alpha-like isoform X2 n=2 Tax=Perca flavescens TaxID=8167 RepID=UPI00106DEC97|nr:granulocyte-macrophage colony-stimulating factor receptor subunit alpha-like isoform X2 [Perca flavescens]
MFFSSGNVSLSSVQHRQSATEWTDSWRLAMKLFPVHSILWSSLLVLCASQNETEAYNPDVCPDDHGNIIPHSPLEQGHKVEEDKVDKENIHCLFYPTNILNCSWSFPTLQKDTQIFVNISVCDDFGEGPALNLSSEERVGSLSSFLHAHEGLFVILRFNITLHDMWTVYICPFEVNMLEVLSPPPNISASVKDGGLVVTWGLPHSREDTHPYCFEYQLDMGDQERSKTLTDQLSYTEPNPDPHRTYNVRMRTRMTSDCQQSPQWSDWSHTVTVKQSFYKLNTLVIISISLGIPMILLAVLLLVRHQRVSKVLFPQIPCPPPKYKYFLEKNDTFNVFYPAPSAEPVEEITEVEDTEQKPR